jgi:RHS repeat-associated protein
LAGAYDANDGMVVASQANRPDAVSVYDALGNRVAEKVEDVWQFVIYDAFGKIVAEYGGANLQDAGGVKYLIEDWQGSVRAGVNAGGFVKSRTDHQAFGEDIASGVGLRTTTQGYGAPATNRQGYGLTEKDSATGLNHTWFRKNENRAGRWTSPDPYNGSASVADPQSWNRYSYVENEPTNFVDPSGLDEEAPILRVETHTWRYDDLARFLWWLAFGGSPFRNGGDLGGGGGGGDEPVIRKNDKWCEGVEGFTNGIGRYSAQELNDAVTTVFGEISAQIHPYIYGEAAAVASVIFNRSDAILNATQGNNPFGRTSSLSDVANSS